MFENIRYNLQMVSTRPIVPNISFKDLRTSTLTMMVYSNIHVDLKKIYLSLPVYKTDVPLTKKKHNPDVKRAIAPYGSIISLRYIDDFRGIVTKPDVITKRKLKEKLLNKIKFTDDEVELVRTYGKHEARKHRKTHTYGTELTPDALYEIGIKYLVGVQHFRNQVTCIMTLADNKKINVMIFNNNYKIVGCCNERHAEECIMILWEDYIRPRTDIWTRTNNDPPRFVFEKVMINVGFKLGFHIVRSALNTLLNDPKYKHIVHISKFVSTGTTSVNTKFYPTHYNEQRYYCLEYNTAKVSFIKLDSNPYQGKSRPRKEKDTTVLSFYSSKIIMSGRYMKSLKEVFEFMILLITNHIDEISEKLYVSDEPFVL